MGTIIKKIAAVFFSIVVLYACGNSSEKSPSVNNSPAKSPSVKEPDLVTDALVEKRITQWRMSPGKPVSQERIYSEVLAEDFYKRRNDQPAWSSNGILAQADTLIKAIEEAYDDGLTPDYYHLDQIKLLVDKVDKEAPRDAGDLADLDILLTDSFLTLGCHLSAGCVNPVTIQSEWFAKHGNVDVSSVLDQAIRKKQVQGALSQLRPEQASYNRLRKALAQYRELSSKGEFPLVSTGPRLKKGAVSDRVMELRKRLEASGDLDSSEITKGTLFDGNLEQSIIAFQKRHGLKADGIVDSKTCKALNVPLKQRIRQMELNMERLRWILGNQDHRSINVNIANFDLNVFENWKSVLSMKAVVGKPYLSTPVFTAKLTYLLINPSWNVPDSIARKEIINIIKKDPAYLTAQNMKVLKGWGPREEEIDPQTIDWSKITATNLAYRFRQEPGPKNALGHIKFMLPNKYDVYLHDTSARRLFSENVRAFSHGCTRIEKPVELAEYLLRDAPGWSRERLLAAIETGVEQKVMIPHPINVNFLYLTAWVNDEGTVEFRDDIYGRDRLLDEALQKKPSFH